MDLSSGWNSDAPWQCRNSVVNSNSTVSPFPSMMLMNSGVVTGFIMRHWRPFWYINRAKVNTRTLGQYAFCFVRALSPVHTSHFISMSSTVLKLLATISSICTCAFGPGPIMRGVKHNLMLYESSLAFSWFPWHVWHLIFSKDTLAINLKTVGALVSKRSIKKSIKSVTLCCAPLKCLWNSLSLTSSLKRLWHFICLSSRLDSSLLSAITIFKNLELMVSGSTFKLAS